MAIRRKVAPILIERAAEQLRQEQEVFEQRRSQESRWFYLRLVMGYSAVVLLVSVMAVASYVLLNNDQFQTSVVSAAGAALFLDVLGLLVAVWKIVLKPSSITELTSVTKIDLPDLETLQHDLEQRSARLDSSEP